MIKTDKCKLHERPYMLTSCDICGLRQTNKANVREHRGRCHKVGYGKLVIPKIKTEHVEVHVDLFYVQIRHEKYDEMTLH